MSFFTILATSKVAAGVLAAGAVAAGGTGVAAFSGALPTEIQQGAHNLVGAPAPVAAQSAIAARAAEASDAGEAVKAKATGTVEGAQTKATDAAGATQTKATNAVESGRTKATDAVKDATSPEAFDLCTAILNGGLKSNTNLTGYKSLVVAAGGEASVDAHCKAVVDAGKTAGLKADAGVQGNADAGASVASTLPALPAAPAVPAVPPTPAAPAVPRHVVTDVPVPSAAADSVR